MGSGIALGMGVGLVPTSTFFKKWQFLRVILSAISCKNLDETEVILDLILLK